MKKYIDPFLVNLPSIDLHGYDRVGAVLKTDEFIKDSIILKNFKIIIVHGKGEGILKNEIHNFLKRDKRVEKYYLDLNIGCTIVELIKEK